MFTGMRQSRMITGAVDIMTAPGVGVTSGLWQQSGLNFVVFPPPPLLESGEEMMRLVRDSDDYLVCDCAY